MRASSLTQWKLASAVRNWYDHEANRLGIFWDGQSNSWLSKTWQQGKVKFVAFPMLPNFSHETALFDCVLFRLRHGPRTRPTDMQRWLGVTPNDMRNVMWVPKEQSFVFRTKMQDVALTHRFNLRDYDFDVGKAWAAARDFRDMYEVSKARGLVYNRRRMLQGRSEMSVNLRSREVMEWVFRHGSHLPPNYSRRRKSQKTVQL